MRTYLSILFLFCVALLTYLYMQNRLNYVDKVNNVLISLLQKQIQNEKTKAFNFALALSQNASLLQSIEENDSKKAYQLLKHYGNAIKTYSGSEVQAQILTKEFVIFARSWDNSDAGLNVKKNRPDLAKVKESLQPHLSFEAARRLVLIASIPIAKDGKLIGFIEIIQRVDILKRFFIKLGIDVLVLLKDKYENQAVLLKSHPKIKNMIVVNDNANLAHIQTLKELDIHTLLQKGKIKNDHHYFFSTSIFNALGYDLGSIVLILSHEKVALLSSFEHELDSFFFYSGQNVFSTSLNKYEMLNLNMYNKKLLKENNNAKVEQNFLSKKHLQSYTKEELIELISTTQKNTLSRGKIQ